MEPLRSIHDVVREQCRCGGFCEDGLVCEAHPWLGWPHDDCGAPGMPCSQPIHDPRRPTSGETFISWHEVFGDPMMGSYPSASPEAEFWGYVRSLGLKPEDYEATRSHNRFGWNLSRKRDGV